METPQVKTIRLKEPLESSKFGVVFPAHVDLNFFVDAMKRVFAQHPKHTSTYIRVAKKNIVKQK